MLKVLFLCTGNSARSQIAEAILNYRGKDRIIAYSAGSDPAEEVNPYVVRAMKELGIDISDKKPKSQNAFSGEYFDFIITLCDRARDQCPTTPSTSIHAHWGFADPNHFTGADNEIMNQVRTVVYEIGKRIDLFLSLPLENSDRDELKKRLDEIREI